MRADNIDRLRVASRERAERTLARAVEALNTMGDGTVTVARLAAAAGVSRSWIYTQPQLVEQIESLARTRPHVASTDRPAAQRASSASLQRRLELAHQRVRQLSEENERLRDELARTYGRLRERD
jgi:septal ring factor EnvC (AmiA/AmiB activator)